MMAQKRTNGRNRASSELPRTRACGCVFYSAELDRIFPCRDAVALQASNRLAEMLAAAAPADSFFVRLSSIARSALLRHYGLTPAAIEQACKASEPSPDPHKDCTSITGTRREMNTR